MSIKDWPGGVVSKEQVVPSGPYLDSTASGIWTMDQAANYTKQGIWPTAGNAEPDVASVFSTYLYTGNGSTQTITNGIDLAGEGGMTWIKLRNSASNNELYDTERGATNSICSNTLDATIVRSTSLTSFNSDGFTLGAGTNVNANNYTVASWTFRKAPKFFDIVTYTGNATIRTISHNLGTTVGTIMIKDLQYGNWSVYHRSAGNTKYLILNGTNAEQTDSTYWNSTDPTDSVFTLGPTGAVNENGRPFVAYLFGHETDASSMVQCGGYTGTGSNGNFVSLGWEPQWVMVKKTDAAGAWEIQDSMRGIVEGQLTMLEANTSAAEVDAATANCLSLTATGFNVNGAGGSNNANGGTYIYTAIRAPMMIAPTVGTDVFMPLTYTATGSAGNKQTTGFPVDLTLIAPRSGTDAWKHAVISRLTGGDDYLSTSSTAAEVANGSGINLDDMTGYDFDGAAFNNSSDMYNLNWKRAKGYMDCVAYTGNGTAGRTVSHSLGVAPEMMWVKRRNTAQDWAVFHKDEGATKTGRLDSTATFFTATSMWNDVAPTSTEFTVGTSGFTNGSTDTYMAYLFASLAGVSKVGSFTATGNDVDVDCGFSNGARFVLIKRTDSADDWFVFDTARGIAAGNDKRLKLNSTAAEATTDNIDPLSSGFTMTAGILGSSGNTFIFYAIA